MSKEQKEQYRKEMRRDWDYKNTMDYAVARGRAEGKEEGLAEGLAQGKEKGRAEGLAEGLTQGKVEEQQAIARRMREQGLSVEMIAACTKLTEDQIRAL